jgi:hypothetical protein
VAGKLRNVTLQYIESFLLLSHFKIQMSTLFMFVFEFPSLSGTVDRWDRQAGQYNISQVLESGSGTGAGIVAAIDWLPDNYDRMEPSST